MKLIVHIGAGKTGSSSIQKALEASFDPLGDQNMKYLGLMLEHGSGSKIPSWRKTSGSPEFFLQYHQKDAIEQLKAVLLEEMQHPENAGLHALIWSNEWMFERAERILPALKLVEAEGVDVEIVVYVRRHDRWIASSYVQWGIKNKAYPGPIRPFSEWLKGREFTIEKLLSPWLSAFGENVSVLNFDASSDVVEHFLKRLGLPPVSVERKNVSPPAAELAAWAVYNNLYKQNIPENRFAVFLRRFRREQENSAAVPELASLLPTVDELKDLQDQYSEDRAFVNRLLAEAGEPEFDDEREVQAPKLPGSWEMNRLLLEMVYHLNTRLSALERHLQEKK